MNACPPITCVEKIDINVFFNSIIDCLYIIKEPGT